MTHWYSSEEPEHTGRTGSRRRFLQILQELFAAEADRYFLWTPVLIGGGAVIYFSLSAEPSSLLVAGAVSVALPVAYAVYRAGYWVLGVALCLVVLGLALGKARTETLMTVVVERDTPVVTVSGWVEDAELRSANRQRVLIRVHRLYPWTQAQTPEKVRISLSRKSGDLLVGSAVSFKAKLFKPARPVSPGAFDFSRRNWFRGIGGSGYGFGDIATPDDLGPAPAVITIKAAISSVRNAIARKIREHLQGNQAAYAVAILTGLRGGLPEPVVENLRAAGLAHLLAISGLHMSLIALTLFWFVRALFAVSERAALRYPIKKLAAVVALTGGAAYLAISGAAVSTQRAFIMIAIMLLAMIIQRPAISMHNLALAALVLVIWRPESVLDVSFQMSFLTVVALIAAYEHRGHMGFMAGATSPGGTRFRRWTKWGLLYVFGIVVSTLVAGLATGPIAAFHFNRIAVFGIVGNLIAIPLMALMIMPLALLAVLLMPFGLEGWPLTAAGWGISALLDTAEFAANIPGAVRTVSAMPGTVLFAVITGMLWLCLWRTRLRWAGPAIIVSGLAIAAGIDKPDVLVEQEGRLIAVRTPGGELVPSSAKSALFAQERWLSRDGDQALPKQAASRDGMRCDDEGCTVQAYNGVKVALLKRVSGLWDECRNSDIVITAFSFKGSCGAAKLVIDRGALYAHGAHAVYFSEGGFRVERVSDHQGNRPWSDTRGDVGQPRGKQLATIRDANGR